MISLIIRIVAWLAPFLKTLWTRLGTWLAASVGIQTASQMFLCALLVTLFTVVLPVILQKYTFTMATYLLNLFGTSVNLNTIAIHFSGMGAWIAYKLGLPAAFSAYMGFVSVKLAMRLTSPFTRF